MPWQKLNENLSMSYWSADMFVHKVSEEGLEKKIENIHEIIQMKKGDGDQSLSDESMEW